MWAAIVAFFGIVGSIIKFMEEKKKAQEQTIKELKDAIKNGDTSTINSKLS